MTNEHEVSATSEAIYAALNDMANGNSAAMGGIWAESSSATTMHPIGDREQGYDVIIGSFAKVAEIAGGGDMPRFVTLDAIPEISAWAEIQQCSIGNKPEFLAFAPKAPVSMRSIPHGHNMA